MLIGTEIEYAPTSSGIPAVGPIFLSGAVVAAYLGVPLPSGEPSFDGAWMASLADDGLIAAPRVCGVVAGHKAGLPSAFLANGARIYVDHAHPEYASPESATPLEAAMREYAGDQAMYQATVLASEILSHDHPDAAIRMFKSNSDGKGNSWGAHENYLLPREVPWEYIERAMLPFFVTRQIIIGAGKIGSEHDRPAAAYQVSQRADFFESSSSLVTTHHRGVMNTRDEPHGDPDRYRRLHVITGDANRAPYAMWLKLGITALTLTAMYNHAMDPLKYWVALANPARAIWKVSHDPNMTATISLDSGGTTTALDIQEHYFEMVHTFIHKHDAPPWAFTVLDGWRSIIEGLQLNPMSLADRIDWLAKYKVILDSNTDPHSPKAKAIDHLYHELGPNGIASKMIDSGALIFPPGFSLDRVAAAHTDPPATRAALRAAAIAQDPDNFIELDWSYGVLSSGQRIDFPISI